MERGGEFTKAGKVKPGRAGVRQFLERRFDLIALCIITLLILLSLILF